MIGMVLGEGFIYMSGDGFFLFGENVQPFILACTFFFLLSLFSFSFLFVLKWRLACVH